MQIKKWNNKGHPDIVKCISAELLPLKGFENEKFSSDGSTLVSETSSSIKQVKVEINKPIGEPKGFTEKETFLEISFIEVSNIKLEIIKEHNARFAINITGNGFKSQSDWVKPSSSIKTLNFKETLNIPLSIDSVSIMVDFKCKYRNTETAIQEVVEKIPIKKKFQFGKSTFKFQRRFIQKKLGDEPWDIIIDWHKNVRSCKFDIEKLVSKNKNETKNIEMDLINSWSKNQELRVLIP